jgi:hypothetical protein
MSQGVCETSEVAYEASDDLRAAKEAAEVAKDAYDKATEHLHAVIAAEVAKPTRPADVARFMNMHPGYIRRIARDRGVAPHIDVEPPRRRSDPHSTPS